MELKKAAMKFNQQLTIHSIKDFAELGRFPFRTNIETQMFEYFR